MTLSSELASFQKRVNMFLVLAVLWQHQDGVSANESSVEVRCLNPKQMGSVSKATGWTQQPMALATEGSYRKKGKYAIVYLEIT